MSIKCILAISLCTLGLRAEQPWHTEDYRQSPKTFPAPEVDEAGVSSLYFEGPDFNGKPTKVFAFVGLPENASSEHPVPGVVLVHGGGGTAFARWVRTWNAHGYAAIAIDHYGQIPIREEKGWKRNPEAGPGSSWIDSEPEQQWMFHAVADTMLAHSLLASMPEVDSVRIGMVGVSWGGVIACNVAGLDDRFRFVVPIYGCGYISVPDEEGSQFVGLKYTPEQRTRWQQLWDPASHLSGAAAPMLWMTGTNDFAFTFSALMRSSKLVQGPQTFCIRVRMPHGQQVAEKPVEPIAFADSIVADGPPLPQVTNVSAENGIAQIDFTAALPVVSAQFAYTQDEGRWQDREWHTQDISLDPSLTGSISMEIPDDTRAYFFTLTDERGLLASSPPILN